jgi:uncharacterized protein YecE (DUF72 family)
VNKQPSFFENKKRDCPFKTASLKYYAGKFKEWVKEGQEAWAYFNNYIYGYATKDALRIIAVFGENMKRHTKCSSLI